MESTRPGFLRRLAPRGRKSRKPAPDQGPIALPITRFYVCGHHRCVRGAPELLAALKKEGGRKGLDLKLGRAPTLCDGRCRQGPFVALPQPGLFYQGVAAEGAGEIIRETAQKGRILFELLLLEPYALTDHRIHFDREQMVMVLMEPKMCLVDAAFYLFGFNARESCGKCVPCRVGVHLVAAWERELGRRRAGVDALELLERRLSTMAQGAYCEFGAKVTAPLRLALSQGRENFAAHLDGGCPMPGGHVLSAKTLGGRAGGAN